MRQLELSNIIVGLDNLDELKKKLSRALVENDDVALVKVASEIAKANIYDVKASMIEVLFHQELDLRGEGLLQRDDLARKIRNANGKVLLEEVEWIDLKNAVNTAPGLNRHDVPFMRLVTNAPAVEVEAKECKPLPTEPEPDPEPEPEE
jgi:hypothetical protein